TCALPISMAHLAGHPLAEGRAAWLSVAWTRSPGKEALNRIPHCLRRGVVLWMRQRSWWLELVVHLMHVVRGLGQFAAYQALIADCHPSSPSGLRGMPLGGGLAVSVQQGALG